MYGFNVDEIYGKISAKEAKQGWDLLSHEERVFAVVMNMTYEVGNGGLLQYYSNSSGDDADNLPASLTEIGAKKTSAIIVEVNTFFGKNGPHKSCLERQRISKTFSDDKLSKIDNYDTEINSDPEDIEVLLLEYAKNKKLNALL